MPGVAVGGCKSESEYSGWRRARVNYAPRVKVFWRGVGVNFAYILKARKFSQTINRNRPWENWIANEVLLLKIYWLIYELSLDSLSVLEYY